MKKVLSTLAIYNDFGFLASVGEVTAGAGDNHTMMMITNPDRKVPGIGDFLSGLGFKVANQQDPSDWGQDTTFEAVKSKPGSRAYIHQYTEEMRIPIDGEAGKAIKQMYNLPFWYDDDIEFENVQQDPKGSFVTGNEGWCHPKDRPMFTPFTLNWDEWDRELLRNSISRIKTMFKPLYYAAQDRPGSKRGSQTSPAKIKLRNLKARLFPAPGAGILPWWQRRRLKTNPYNADGELCDGPDLLG